MQKFLVLSALLASASAFGPAPVAPVASKLAMSKVARTAAPEMASKGTIIGAASVGGIVGIWLTGELSTGAIFAAVLAYAATTDSKFGNFAASTGENAEKVYDKTLELNSQYDVLPKARAPAGTAGR